MNECLLTLSLLWCTDYDDDDDMEYDEDGDYDGAMDGTLHISSCQRRVFSVCVNGRLSFDIHDCVVANAMRLIHISPWRCACYHLLTAVV